MKYYVMVVSIIACIIYTLFAVILHHNNKKVPIGMPPGYYLECNDQGIYRPCRDGSSLFGFVPSTRSAAIIRAWEQYEYEAKYKKSQWKKCN